MTVTYFGSMIQSHEKRNQNPFVQFGVLENASKKAKFVLSDIDVSISS